MSVVAQRHGGLRRAAIVLLAVLLAVLAAVLVIAATTGGRSVPAPQRAQQHVAGRPAPGPLSDVPHALDPAAARAARAFLSGYLAYLSGQVSAGRIPDAAPRLVAALGPQRLSSSPAARRHPPAVARLGAQEPGGAVLHVTALIDDGIARYPVRMVMVHGAAGWQVSRLLGAE